MTTRRFLLMLMVLFIIPLRGLTAQENPFADLAAFETALNAAVESGEFDPFWEQVVSAGQMPLIFEDTAVFLYRGAGEKVEWRGDFTGWDTDPDFQGERLGESDVWIMQAQFPMEARLDYKIVVDDNTWLLDPLNPQEQWGGFGPNSELRMPDYVYPEFTIAREEVAHGDFTADTTIFSQALGYAVNYRVYRPAGYTELDDLPVIYITDGQEYADEKLGSMINTLDNLIADGQIQPLIAVFVDPRNPDNSDENRRESELITNPDYAEFLATELVPLIDVIYDTNPSPETRAILGTSLGGLNAAYVGLNYAEVFGLVGIQSPALWVADEVINEYETADPLPIKIFMSQGSVWDDIELTHRLRDILTEKDYELHFMEIPEGHSWGNWRALLDDLLIYFFPA